MSLTARQYSHRRKEGFPSYHSSAVKPDRPSILEVVERYVSLRKAGKEFIGLCPFHSEKTPSFYINEEKGVFLCRGCQTSGDVFTFIMKVEGLSFPEACVRLGVKSTQARAAAPDPVLAAARRITRWANEQTTKANSLLREIGQRMRLASALRWREEVQRLSREWIILVDLAEDLQNPAHAVAIWESREAIENLLQDAEAEPLLEFPEMTEEYREQLRRYVRGFDA